MPCPPTPWIPPQTGTFKINVDRSAGRQCAMAAISRDHTSSFFQGETRELQACNPEEAKAVEFYLALKLV